DIGLRVLAIGLHRWRDSRKKRDEPTEERRISGSHKPGGQRQFSTADGSESHGVLEKKGMGNRFAKGIAQNRLNLRGFKTGWETILGAPPHRQLADRWKKISPPIFVTIR
ncbi:MAG: hypothetical protein AAF958_10260, partial [Planctomycetota bacterium]